MHDARPLDFACDRLQIAPIDKADCIGSVVHRLFERVPELKPSYPLEENPDGSAAGVQFVTGCEDERLNPTERAQTRGQVQDVHFFRGSGLP